MKKRATLRKKRGSMTLQIQSYLLPLEHKAISNLYNFLDRAQVSRPWLNGLVTPIVLTVEISKSLAIPIYAIEGAALTAIKLACDPSVNTAWKLCKHTVTALLVTATIIAVRQTWLVIAAHAAYTTYNSPTTFRELASVADEVASHKNYPIIQEIYV